jgi:ABC-type sugar transport system ATPase subunit
MIGVEQLTVHAGDFALRDVSFEVPAGAYAVLMGRTGAGKTTLLEAICGLKRAEAGSIRLMGIDVTKLKPARRGVAYVPQDRALFTTMSVAGNLAFALVVRRWPRNQIRQRVAELADVLGIGHLLNRPAIGLSGGEAQRVALGRALAPRPGILLLDEPLSALDNQTRQEMHELLISLRRRSPVTTLHVTHSLSDAQRLADRVLVLEDGKVR